MASLARSLSTRVKKIEKPKPLKNIVPNRHSFSDREFLFQSNSEPLPDIKTPDIPIRSGGPEDTLILLDIVTSSILSKDYSNLATLTTNLVNRLKCHGSQLEEHSEGKLDTAFETIRNGAHDIVIDRQSRLNLLQLVELRASRWQISPSTASYYSSKSGHHHELQSEVYGDSGFDFSQQQLLGPGDVLKSSGKYSSPTRVLGKNYCKDEVVIRNSDSGKVMGIKGRRVHMIEELSETVISFQRVNPGAKERLVQITGPSEDKIIYAKNLIEDTIKRNASPVREVSLGAGSRDVAGSNSSINSSASDESNRINTPSVRSSTGKMDSAEYKYSVHVQNEVIHISSTNLSLLNEAFSLLDTSYAIVQEGGGPSLPSPEVPKPVEAPPEPFAPFGGEPSHSDGDKIIENAPVTVSDKSVENKQDNNQNGGYNLQYSREFLLQCSKSRFAVTPPAILPVISAQYPAIVRQSPVAFDAVFHQKKWLTTEGRIASFTTYAEDYLDSD